MIDALIAARHKTGGFFISEKSFLKLTQIIESFMGMRYNNRVSFP